MTAELPIVAMQIAPAGDPEQTLRTFESQVRAIAATFPTTLLVVAPEQHLSATPGFPYDDDGCAGGSAVDIPGELTDRLARLAQETGLWLVPGTVYERGDKGIHNTAIVLNPAGQLVARYRKVFPWQPFETSVPGTEFVCFDIPDVGRVGLAVCYDGAFPETARQLAWMGADVMVQPTLTPTVDREAELVMARANAIANQMFVVNVNAAAPHGVGRSVIVDPEGRVRVEAGATEQFITDVLDLSTIADVRRRGSFGLNRFWEQLDRYGSAIELPAYGGNFQPRKDA